MLRHFEQRTVLAEAGQGVQLLVKRKMIALHGILEGLLRRLARLAGQRRLSDGSRDGAGDELFEAAWLLGQLVGFRQWTFEFLGRCAPAQRCNSMIAP